MELVAIQVESYAGYKADETPRRFVVGDQRHEVREVVDRWHQTEPRPDWSKADYFRVLAEDGRLYLLKHDLDAGQWHLVLKS